MRCDEDGQPLGCVHNCAVMAASTPKELPTIFHVRRAVAREACRYTFSRPVDGFLVEIQKISPASDSVTAHSPNRMDGRSASSVGMPKPRRATTMAPSRTPQPPIEIGSMEMSRTVGTTINH